MESEPEVQTHLSMGAGVPFGTVAMLGKERLEFFDPVPPVMIRPARLACSIRGLMCGAQARNVLLTNL